MYAGPSIHSAAGAGGDPRHGPELKPLILDAVMLVERVHRRFLDVVKDELDRLGRTDVNPVQAVLLHNIGDADLTAGDLKTRGYYLGTNVSYNVKKLTEAGCLVHERCTEDRRAVRIRLTDKGRRVAAIVDALYEKNTRTIGEVGGLGAVDLERLSQSLSRLDRFWDDQIRYRL